MRTLKFRAYDEEAECFCYTDKDSQGYFFEFYYRDEHTYGELRAFRIIEDSGSIHEPPSVKSKVLDNIQQFTGLKDKNGKEIFEGDVVNFIYWESGESSCRVVAWDEEDTGFYIQNETDEWPHVKFYYATEIEIIGNIYEDSHLLNSDT